MDKEEAPKNIILVMIEDLFSIWAEMFEAVMSVLPKWFSLFFWLLLAIPTLLCVLVANAWFPKWVKWGEGF
jgi:hypothetical protein